MKNTLELASQCRTADANRYWLVFQVMSAINTGMITFSVKYLDRPLAFIPVAMVGAVLCYLWWGMQLRYALWARWWDRKVREIEEAPETAKVFVGRKLEDADYAGINTRFLPLVVESGDDTPALSTKSTPVLVAKLFCVVWILLFSASIGIWICRSFGCCQ